MHQVVLGVHNLIRWLVLLAGVYAVVLAWRGWLGRGAWTRVESRGMRLFVGALDTQLLVGVLLYALFSPLTRQAFGDLGGAMRDAPVRYFLVEHVAIMLAAIASAHVGAARVKRARTDAERFQRASIWLGLALAAVAGFIPWARPLIPTFGS
jgi:hypothetical protein